ncbi:unnamed protein product, partial [Trichobilharzia regenti]
IRFDFCKWVWNIITSECTPSYQVFGHLREQLGNAGRQNQKSEQNGAPRISACYTPGSDSSVNVLFSSVRGGLFHWGCKGTPNSMLLDGQGHSMLISSIQYLLNSPGLFPTPELFGERNSSGNQNKEKFVSISPRGCKSSSITTLSSHSLPQFENVIAYGTESGCVEIVNINKLRKMKSQKPKPQLYAFGSTVYQVAWWPLLFSDIYRRKSNKREQKTSENHSKSDNSSASAAHIIEQEDENSTKDDEAVSKFSSYVYSIIAVGYRSGEVDIYGFLRSKSLNFEEEVVGQESRRLVFICRNVNHSKCVNCLTWSRDHYCQGEYSKPIQLPTSSARLEGHYNRITRLDWSPHDPFLLLSASFDGTANVWRIHPENIKKDNFSISNFRALR